MESTHLVLPSPVVRVRLLGPLEVSRRFPDGSWQAVERKAWDKGTPPRSVFKRLLTTPGRRLSRLAIQEDLWPEASMELADRYLNNAVMVSRQIIGKTLVETIGPLYEIAGQSQVWTDVDACSALVREAENQGCTTPQALPLLEEAFRYFERGKCLEDEAERWCHAVRADAERVQRQCHLWLADGYEGVGKLWQAGEVYRTMIHALPGDEEALQSWMQMLVRQGKQREAFKCYQETKTRWEAQGFPLSNELEQMVASLNKQPTLALISPFQTLGDRMIPKQDIGQQNMNPSRRDFFQGIFGAVSVAFLHEEIYPDIEQTKSIRVFQRILKVRQALNPWENTVYVKNLDEQMKSVALLLVKGAK